MQVRTGAHWEPERDALLSELRHFARVMERAPFRNEGGIRGVSAFALYWFLRRVQPTIVFDVGVWRGFGTWLIEQAVPEAQIHCFDPIFLLRPHMSRWRMGRLYRPGTAKRWTQDFSCAPVAALVAGHERPLAFFDDHQNKLPRLLQCRAAGIRDMVFDDNYIGVETHRSLEDEGLDPEGRAAMECEIESYRIFPALWPVEAIHGPLHIREQGLGFPVEKELGRIHGECKWHSFVTWVHLRPAAVSSAALSA